LFAEHPAAILKTAEEKTAEDELDFNVSLTRASFCNSMIGSMRTTFTLLVVSLTLALLSGCANPPRVTGSSMTSVNSPGPWNGINPNNAMPSQ
jgi:hypothetical protein